MLTFTASGPGGHSVVTFEGGKVLVNYHKTSPSERGMIETLVERGLKRGLKLHRSKKGEPGDPLERLMDVLMDAKGEVALLGAPADVDALGYEIIEHEVRGRRIVTEAQPDGSWKVLRLGDLKKPDEAKPPAEPAKELAKKDEAKPAEAAKEEKRAVHSSAPVGGG